MGAPGRTTAAHVPGGRSASRSGGSRALRAALVVLAAVGLLWAANPASAQPVVHTISNVPSPNHRALNQATNRLYVTDAGTTTVTVVDTTSDVTHAIDLGTGNSPVGIALDATTNLLYVTLTTGTVAVGPLPPTCGW